MALFSLVRHASNETNSPETFAAVSFQTPPNPGDLFCLAGYIGAGLISIQDSNGNNYTPSVHSPVPLGPGQGQNILAYLIAPANPHELVTVFWTDPNTFSTLFLAEFSFTCPAVAYDKDAVQQVTPADGTHVSSPTIAPSMRDSLLFAMCNPPIISVVAPTTGSSAGPWTGLDIDPSTFIGTEYDLDASEPTAVNFTLNSSNGDYVAMAMAFSPVPGTPVSSGSMGILKGPHRGSRMTPPYNP
jgi:hypothetical protein